MRGQGYDRTRRWGWGVRDTGIWDDRGHDGEPHGQEREEPQRQMAPPDSQGHREQGPAGEGEQEAWGWSLDDSDRPRRGGYKKETTTARLGKFMVQVEFTEDGRCTGVPTQSSQKQLLSTAPPRHPETTLRWEAEEVRPMELLHQPGNLPM